MSRAAISRIALISVCVALLGIGAFFTYQYFMLKKAHSSFENYYAFRGCKTLVERADTYGICRLTDGSQIKIVQYEGRWFLDGDLPGVW